jgi:hypothetical protein
LEAWLAWKGETMTKQIVVGAAVVLIIASCERTPAFSPPPDSYSESRATIEGTSGERAIGRIDSTFFGRNLPLVGRLITPQEYDDGSPVAILSYEFWMAEFEGRPDIIGSNLRVDDVERTIVGIMPQGVTVPENVALWIPRQ